MSDSESFSSLGVPRQKTDSSNKLDILVEETEHTHSRGTDRKYKGIILKAAASGDWVTASSYDKTHPNWLSTPLTVDGDTALHIAVAMEKMKFLAKLVERACKQDTEIRKRSDGNTAFCIAAIAGNEKIAKTLFVKNPGLAWIRGHEEMLPIQLASLAGQRRMVKFLFERTKNDMLSKLAFQDIVKLFFITLTGNIYEAALWLLDKNPRLATTGNEKGLTALQVLAQSTFDKHAAYRHLLHKLFEGIEEEEDDFLLLAMFDAAKSGNNMILEFIFDYNPNLFMKVNYDRQNILQIAISYRQGRVFRLILRQGEAYKNVLMQHIDNEGNNILHLAGTKNGAVEVRFGSPIFQSFVCSEELWFKEVENIVPPAFKTMKNKDNNIPQELFYEQHKRDSEKAIAEMNGIANNFLVVATLLVTLGVTGALTIRTNPISGKTRIFKEDTWYTIFIISVGFGVSSCATSMLLFTSVILPSTWGGKGGSYVNSRLIRMTFGYLFLYASVFAMGVFSTISGAFLVYNFVPEWAFYIIAVGVGIPTFSYFVLFYHSFYISWFLIRTFCQYWASKIVSIMGVPYKWDPFYLE